MNAATSSNKRGILNDINKEKEITKKYYEDNYIDKEDYKKGMPKKRCLFYKSFIEKNEKITPNRRNRLK